MLGECACVCMFRQGERYGSLCLWVAKKGWQHEEGMISGIYCGVLVLLSAYLHHRQHYHYQPYTTRLCDSVGHGLDFFLLFGEDFFHRFQFTILVCDCCCFFFVPLFNASLFHLQYFRFRFCAPFTFGN